MDRPLRFALRAKLPTGEIVPVKLVYSNLHRYCRHCRHVSHEVESCPQLSEAERTEKSSRLEEDRDLPNFNRIDAQRKGETSKQPLPQLFKDRRSGEDTHRDTRDSVWKRIDSRYDPRVDPRPSAKYDHRHDSKPVDRQRDPPIRDSYNKRRYDESFLSSKQREASRRERDKGKDREISPSKIDTRDLAKEFTRELLARILEEEDWLDDGNDFGDVDGNEFEEEDIDLMEEDDLLGEELRIENEKHLQIDDSGIVRAEGGANLDITDGSGSGSGKVVDSTVDSEEKTPTKGASFSSDHVSGSSASVKKKRGSRSPSTFGVSLRQRNLKSGLGSPKFLSVGSGPNGSKAKQSGPSPSTNQRKAREA
ncbi:unnamed protein product, partial [Brassica oleracea var. botrytis]